jgi:hypothetical protein
MDRSPKIRLNDSSKAETSTYKGPSSKDRKEQLGLLLKAVGILVAILELLSTLGLL